MTTAVFLGAGASKAFGHPLTTEILPRILRRADEGTLFARRNPTAQTEAEAKLAWFRPRLHIYRSFFPSAKLTYRTDGTFAYMRAQHIHRTLRFGPLV